MASSPSVRSDYLRWLSQALGSARVEAVSGSGTVDVVAGYATGYDAHHIAPFVRSLRSVFDGEIALAADARPDVQALFAEYGVRFLAQPQTQGWQPHPVMARFAAVDAHLSGRADVRNVLLTDVRDVIFQKAPFQPAPEGLEVFLEGNRLADHAFDMKYLRALAGDAIADDLAPAPAICVGTVLGPRADMVRFCRTVLMLAAVPRSEMGGSFGADQAACNMAIHMGLVEAEVRENYGRVATIGLAAADGFAFRDGQVVNPDGTVSAIVHQHDRHPILAEAVRGRWAVGLEPRERVTPRTLASRLQRLEQSFVRRIPEAR